MWKSSFLGKGTPISKVPLLIKETLILAYWSDWNKFENENIKNKKLLWDFSYTNVYFSPFENTWEGTGLGAPHGFMPKPPPNVNNSFSIIRE